MSKVIVELRNESQPPDFLLNGPSLLFTVITIPPNHQVAELPLRLPGMTPSPATFIFLASKNRAMMEDWQNATWFCLPCAPWHTPRGCPNSPCLHRLPACSFPAPKEWSCFLLCKTEPASHEFCQPPLPTCQSASIPSVCPSLWRKPLPTPLSRRPVSYVYSLSHQHLRPLPLNCCLLFKPKPFKMIDNNQWQ